MKNFRLSDYVAIISVIGMMAWIVSDLFGGMILYFFTYPLLVLLIIILYGASVLQTLISIIRRGIRQNGIKLVAHSCVLLLVLALLLYSGDIFRSKRVLTATLYEEHFSYRLVFRENGICDHLVVGMFGSVDRLRGEYIMKGDTIIFTKLPYSSKGFIPDTLLVDRRQKAIFKEKDQNGMFKTEKRLFDYFEID